MTAKNKPHGYFLPVTAGHYGKLLRGEAIAISAQTQTWRWATDPAPGDDMVLFVWDLNTGGALLCWDPDWVPSISTTVRIEAVKILPLHELAANPQMLEDLGYPHVGALRAAMDDYEEDLGDVIDCDGARWADNPEVRFIRFVTESEYEVTTWTWNGTRVLKSATDVAGALEKALKDVIE